MVHTISTYRRHIASLLAAWMSVIVISGIVFMHKEVTSKGEIVIHVHPYDFTKKHKHKRHGGIRLFDVLYQRPFKQTDIHVFEVPFFPEFPIDRNVVYSCFLPAVTIFHSYL